METGNQFLGTERVSKLMRQYAIPCIISLLVGALYNIVDQIFIANASYLGSYGNAVQYGGVSADGGGAGYRRHGWATAAAPSSAWRWAEARWTRPSAAWATRW